MLALMTGSRAACGGILLAAFAPSTWQPLAGLALTGAGLATLAVLALAATVTACLIRHTGERDRGA